jgi:hypothetical protein
MMSEGPERIWVEDERPIGGRVHVGEDTDQDLASPYVVRYVRADLYDAAQADLDALRKVNSELIRENARLIAVAQPAQSDREALVEGGLYLDPTGYPAPQPIHVVLSRQASQENCDGEPYDAMMFAAAYIKRLEDALLARGLRLPGGEETMAWAVVGGDGKIHPQSINNQYYGVKDHKGERIVRVAIRVVEEKDNG